MEKKTNKDHIIANAIYTIAKYFFISLILAVVVDLGLYIYRQSNGDLDKVENKLPPKGYVDDEEYNSSGIYHYKSWEAASHLGESCYDEVSTHTPSAYEINRNRMHGLKEELTKVGLITFFGCFAIMICFKYIFPFIFKGVKWVNDNK